MPERPYHHGNLREALLQAAEKTLRERGAQELSLRELAREVGVSHAAPRRHFADRQALLDALAQNGFERLGTDLERAVSNAGPEFEQRLDAIAHAYIRFATRDAALLELMFAGKHQPGGEALEAAADTAFAAVFNVIQQGQAEGALESGDPDRVGLVMFATIQGIASLLNSGIVVQAQLDELIDGAIGNFLRGSRTTV